MKSHGQLGNTEKDLQPAHYTHLPSYINEMLYGGFIDDWIMQHEERSTLIHLLDRLSPSVAIEIGTAKGGSLSVLSHYAEKVYSLDINSHSDLSSRFSNVEFIVGRSQITLPPLLQKLQADGIGIQFVLIDGEHTRDGVKQDIENLLQYKPLQPLYVVLHDSFNPNCRQGMIDASWESSSYVHAVELDFLTGRLEPDMRMTCGFALALMLPWERQGKLNMSSDRHLLYEQVLHCTTSVEAKWKRILKKMIKKMNRYLIHLKHQIN